MSWVKQNLLWGVLYILMPHLNTLLLHHINYLPFFECWNIGELLGWNFLKTRLIKKFSFQPEKVDFPLDALWAWACVSFLSYSSPTRRHILLVLDITNSPSGNQALLTSLWQVMEVGCSQFFKSRWNSGSLDPDIEVDIESVQTEGPQESVNVENMFRADSSIQVGAGINRVYQKNCF